MAGFSATPKESVVGAFRVRGEYDSLWRYGVPTLAVVTLVNDAQRGPHNLGAALPASPSQEPANGSGWTKPKSPAASRTSSSCG